MIQIDAVTPVSKIATLKAELIGIQPGQSFVFDDREAKIVDIVLDMMSISGYSEPIGNSRCRFFVSGINSPQSRADNNLIAMLPATRRDIMRRRHLSASLMDDAVARLGLIATGHNPIIYTMP